MNNAAQFDKSYDIIVVGLGTAGSIALCAAAKKGASVLGVEYLDAMGGTGTIGGVGTYYYGARGGVNEQLNEEVQRWQKTYYAERVSGTDIKAHLLEKTARESGAEIMFKCTVTKVFRQNDRIEGIQCFCNGGFTNIAAKIVIDCTGEAKICRMAGCTVHVGRQSDGETQPYSNVITATNGREVYFLNKDAGYVRQDDPDNLALESMRSLAMCGRMRTDSIKLTNASLLGIREGAVIVGENNIALADFFDGKETNKPLFYAYANLDNHGKDVAFEDDALQQWNMAGLWSVAVSIGIPQGALIPKGTLGLMAAGRCIAVDHGVASCVRMKRDMEKCGEAAAIAAWVSISKHCAVKDVAYADLLEPLSQTGCYDPRNHVGYLKRAGNRMEQVQWPDSLEEVVKGLSGETPGFAIWSVRNKGKAFAKQLIGYICSENRLQAKHTAIATAFAGLNDGAWLLREMAARRDNYVPKTSNKYNFSHGITAVYLLGRLGDRESIPLLSDILHTQDGFVAADFVPNELLASEDDVRFQYVSNALVALKRIADAHPDTYDVVSKTVHETVLHSPLRCFITLKANPHVLYDMTDKLKSYAKLNFAR